MSPANKAPSPKLPAPYPKAIASELLVELAAAALFDAAALDCALATDALALDCSLATEEDAAAMADDTEEAAEEAVEPLALELAVPEDAVLAAELPLAVPGPAVAPGAHVAAWGRLVTPWPAQRLSANLIVANDKQN
jgi:hypothetical protein